MHPQNGKVIEVVDPTLAAVKVGSTEFHQEGVARRAMVSPEQQAGDCKKITCDASGNAVMEPDTADVPEDYQGDCRKPTCDASSAEVHRALKVFLYRKDNTIWAGAKGSCGQPK
jgi:hypothetical protein